MAGKPLVPLSAHEPLVVDRLADVLNRWFAVLFRHWVAVASIWALLTVGGAALTPWLADQGYESIAQILYWAYRPLCPQRPDHSFFIAGHKMAFEQRETAMFIAGAVAGPVYVALKRTRVRVPGWVVFIAASPMVLDIATQAASFRESDGFWRSLTGALTVISFALWAYPKLDTDFARSQVIGAYRAGEA